MSPGPRSVCARFERCAIVLQVGDELRCESSTVAHLTGEFGSWVQIRQPDDEIARTRKCYRDFFSSTCDNDVDSNVHA